MVCCFYNLKFSMFTGHWFCFVRRENGYYYEYSDEDVFKRTISEVKANAACYAVMLMYKVDKGKQIISFFAIMPFVNK